jgi:hypothetical protein
MVRTPSGTHEGPDWRGPQRPPVWRRCSQRGAGGTPITGETMSLFDVRAPLMVRDGKLEEFKAASG